LLLILSYFLGWWFKKGSISPLIDPYNRLFVYYILAWFILSAYYNKFKNYASKTTKIHFRVMVNQSSLILLFLTMICSSGTFNSISRQFILYIVCIPLFVELLAGIILIKHSKNARAEDSYSQLTDSKIRFQYSRILASGSLLAISFIGLHVLGYSGYSSYKSHELTIIVLIINWIISSTLTGKFNSQAGQNLYIKIAPFLKAEVLMVLICGAVYYFSRFEHSDFKYDLFVTSLLFAILELSAAIIYFKFLESPTSPIIIHSESKFGQDDLINNYTYPKDYGKNDHVTMEDKLASIVFPHGLEIRNSISAFFSENNFNPPRYRIFHDSDIFNIELFKHASRDCLLNYYLVNNIQNINDYFKVCYNALSIHGYLMGLYEPQELVRQNLEKKMPRSIFVMYYPIHYIFKRVLPKLPWTSKVHDIITRGKNRLISKAELWGRLTYAGFSISKEYQLNGKIMFIAQKTLSPSQEIFPSYGPLIKLRRTGLNGDIIRIYKLRTMHPYSEFIQKEVYEKNNVMQSGKINNDFRRNEAGKILRKFWLDELPQLFNWLRGDIGLVGVRALSEHYLSLYPSDVQELRKQHRPGLLPPYYADLPKSFEEIVDSERQYLLRKNEQPFITDIVYLKKIFVNIVFKGARSG
jgi:lipopolysaccharide/colanic/teichoic acid biosynthesis glycosyltransferase